MIGYFCAPAVEHFRFVLFIFLSKGITHHSIHRFASEPRGFVVSETCAFISVNLSF